jgi:hypothetical protein
MKRRELRVGSPAFIERKATPASARRACQAMTGKPHKGSTSERCACPMQPSDRVERDVPVGLGRDQPGYRTMRAAKSTLYDAAFDAVPDE